MGRIKPSPAVNNWNQRLTLLIIGIFAVGGIALIFYITAVNPWGYSDSAAYLTTARNIAAGRGIVLQDSNGVYALPKLHSPLFPIVLSLPIALGAQALAASRWLNAILFGLTVFLAGWSTWRFSSSFWLSVSTAGLILLSFEPINAYSGAMSEGLFIFLGLASLFLLNLGIQQRSNQNRLLILSGITAGLSILARYTGLSIMISGCLAILLFNRGTFWSRLRKMLVFLLPATFLAALWLAPVYFSTRTFGGRQINLTGDLAGRISLYFRSFMEVVGGWLPFFYRGNHIITPAQKIVVANLLLVILVLLTVRKIRKKGQSSGNCELLTWAGILLIFCASYILLHLGSFVTGSVPPDINGRILLPLFVAGVLLAAALAAFISRLFPKSWIGGLIFCALAVISIWYFHAQVQLFIFEMRNYGLGYTSKRWVDNPIFDKISTLDAESKLYSNNPALILLYTQRFPKELPIKNPVGSDTDLNIPDDAVFIVFNDPGPGLTQEKLDQFEQNLKADYKIVFEDSDGKIYVPE